MKKSLLLSLALVLITWNLTMAADIYDLSDAISHGDYGGDKESISENMVQDTTTDIQTSETFRPTVIVDGKATLPEKASGAVGSSVSYNKNIQNITIPLSYGMPVSFFGETRQYLNLHAAIPYLTKEVNSVDDSGIGDISIGADYYSMFPSMLLMGSIIVKLPTGEFEDADVPLGTGSTDFGLNLWSGFYLDKVTVKASLGYVIRGEYEDGSSTLTNGNVLNSTIGAEYHMNPKISAGAVMIYKRFEASETDIAGFKSDIPGLQTFDLVPKVTYSLPMNIDITGTLTIPIATSWVTGDAAKPTYDPKRDVTVKLHFMYPF